MRQIFTLFAFTSLIAAGVASAQTAGRIVVEPDVLASHDTSAPHVELTVAASPVDARRLLAAGIVDQHTKVYVSADGGHTWSAHDFDDPEIVSGSGDPQTLYTPKGTGLFVTLGEGRKANGQATSPLIAYRSEDGGATWGPRIVIGDGAWDHPLLAVGADGTIYVVAMTMGKDNIYECALFHSGDDGRTFTGPKVFVRAPEHVVMNGVGLAELPGGKLVALYLQYVNRATTISSQLSSDAGETWSAPHPAGTYAIPKDAPKTLSRHTTWPVFAADENGIYGAWTDMRDGIPRVTFASSKDGVAWTESRPLEKGPGPQYAPAIATDGHHGTVGITWFDASELKEDGAYRVRFAASLDGGRSFLPSKVISSEVSHTFGQGNVAPGPASFVDHRGIQRIAFMSTAGRFFTGGDFQGLAADREGVFHPFWADSRTGTFQAWTTRIRIERVPAAPCPSGSAPVDVSKRVTLVADPPSFGPGEGEISIPFRLRNDGTSRISGPITVEVLGFGDGPKAEMNREFSPTILNSPNQKPAAGAVFDYSKTLGDLCDLPPGGTSGAVVWRFHMKDVTETPQMEVAVKAVVKE